MLAADGMSPEKIALLLRMEAETVQEIKPTLRNAERNLNRR